ncbi:MAG: hypothetical protein QN178_14040 [Armatimonadota bacterium]|nr:hypothetical protein [Armatimonadota bacterium]
MTQVWRGLVGHSFLDFVTRLTVGVLALLMGMVISHLILTIPRFEAASLQVVAHGPVAAGCPVDVVLRYRQQGQGAATLGLFWASRGRLSSVPLGLYDLPEGEHVIGFLVVVPPWLPPGDYRLYLVRAGLSWFGRPESTRVESDRLTVTEPGPCAPLAW